MDRIRVLIADDEPLNAEALAHRVTTLGHTVVGIFDNGVAAIAAAKTVSPDLVLLDVRMPGLDGLEVAERLQALHPVPIILVTGLSDPALFDKAAQTGVMAVLVKPIDTPDLEKTMVFAVTRFGDRAGADCPAPLVIGRQADRHKQNG